MKLWSGSCLTRGVVGKRLSLDCSLAIIPDNPPTPLPTSCSARGGKGEPDQKGHAKIPFIPFNPFWILA